MGRNLKWLSYQDSIGPKGLSEGWEVHGPWAPGPLVWKCRATIFVWSEQVTVEAVKWTVQGQVQDLSFSRSAASGRAKARTRSAEEGPLDVGPGVITGFIGQSSEGR